MLQSLPTRISAIVRLFAVLVMLVWLIPAIAQHDNAAKIIVLDQQVPEASLAGRYTWFEDTTGQLTIEDVNKAAIVSRFKVNEQDDLSLGYTSSAIWLKFLVKTASPGDQHWLLNFNYALLDQIEIYQARKDGGWSLQVMGDRQPFRDRPIHYRTFVTDLALDQQSINTILVRIVSKSSMIIRPEIVTASRFFEQENNHQVLYGLMYGFMLMMAIYNAFLYFSMNDRTYLVYVASVLAGGMFIAALNGHAYQYLWPGLPSLAEISPPLLSALWIIATSLFTQLFIDTRKYTPLLHRFINIIIGLGLVAVLVALFADYRISIRFSTGLGLVSAGLILVTGLLSWYRGNRAARLFSLAWVVYWFGSATLILSRFGIIEDNPVTHHSAALGVIVEIIILSLALSDKYRVMSRRLEDYTWNLERKVSERTKDLRKANRELKRLSMIDALTNLYNRREFDRVMQEEWQRHARSGAWMSLLICDIDEFKQLNDHFGHETGDKVLSKIARVIRDTMNRAADHVSRIGGDEIAVILPETDMAGAAKIADDICEDIRKLGLEQAPDGVYEVVTVSVGVASIVPDKGGQPIVLYKLADEGLYLAKDRGRDQVAIGRR